MLAEDAAEPLYGTALDFLESTSIALSRHGPIFSTESGCDASAVGRRLASSWVPLMTCSSKWEPTALPLGLAPSWKQQVGPQAQRRDQAGNDSPRSTDR